MEEELQVEFISESEGEYECALVNEEGEEKHKFTFELSEDDLLEMTDSIICMDEITKDALYQNLKEEIISLILEKCGEFSNYIDYESLCRYDNLAAGEIASSLSNWIEQRVYEYFNDIYGLSDEQLEEMKKFYDEEIDLNLVIKRVEKSFVLGSEILSAEEMRKIRIAKEKEWMDMKEGRKSSNGFKENLKFEGTVIPHINKQDNENVCQKSEKEVFED